MSERGDFCLKSGADLTSSLKAARDAMRDKDLSEGLNQSQQALEGVDAFQRFMGGLDVQRTFINTFIAGLPEEERSNFTRKIWFCWEKKFFSAKKKYQVSGLRKQANKLRAKLVAKEFERLIAQKRGKEARELLTRELARNPAATELQAVLRKISTFLKNVNRNK